jgi:pilus assembly protein Flp/PilA
MEIMRRLVQEEEGQGMVEYALIIGLISIVLVGVFVTGMDGALDTVIKKITDKLALP